MTKSKSGEKMGRIDKLTFQLPLALKTEFKAKLAKENRTVREALEDCIKKYIRNKNDKL